MERNLPIPDPGHREILVKVEAVGVCASDGKCYSGAEVYWGKPGGLKLIFKKKKRKKKWKLLQCVPQGPEIQFKVLQSTFDYTGHHFRSYLSQKWLNELLS